MGAKARLKKIKKLALKKQRKEDEEQNVSTESIHSDEFERQILNSTIKPPYNVLLDTNFINDCIRKKLVLKDTISDCLQGDVNLFVTECVFAELEKLGRIYRIAVSMLRTMNVPTLKCLHKGTYADNCIFQRIKEFKCYVVATSDTNLRQRIKKVPGVPIVYFRGHRCRSENFVGDLL
ncbi:U3 small nucleolar RNA-associated protein 24 [Pancytospora epiphaga]|nr:U3 small nucleolar RNA-associated protein 24 [Pancytospora epiphaga]